MKVIFLAAGKGKRLTRKQTAKPKCLIKVNGEPLIKRAINLFKKSGLNDIAVIVGYRHHEIRKILGNEVTFFYNPFFSFTNSIASLWFARDYITNDDLIILNADLYYDEKLIDIILSCNKPVTMLADTSRAGEADYKFGFHKQFISRYGKDLKLTETDAEYVGIAKINKSWNHKFIRNMESLIENEQFDLWWEDIIYNLIPKGEKIYYKDIKDTFWIEIDFIEDYNRLKEHGYTVE